MGVMRNEFWSENLNRENTLGDQGKDGG